MSLTLSPMQHRVATMFAAGLTRHEIARRLGVTMSTVGSHCHTVCRRLGVSTRREVAALLPSVEIRCDWNKNRHGLLRGHRVRMTGGRYEGFVGTFVRISNGKQAYVRMGCGELVLRIKHMERI